MYKLSFHGDAKLIKLCKFKTINMNLIVAIPHTYHRLYFERKSLRTCPADRARTHHQLLHEDRYTLPAAFGAHLALSTFTMDWGNGPYPTQSTFGYRCNRYPAR